MTRNKLFEEDKALRKAVLVSLTEEREEAVEKQGCQAIKDHKSLQ